MKSILITGTKGKTSLSLMLNNALLLKKNKVLCVNSEGVFENGKLIKNNDYFLKKYKVAANVAAIKELSAKKIKSFDYVILECSYSAEKNIKKIILNKNFNIGILTNVYHDHIDGIKIKNQKELFEKKLSLLKNIKANGTAIIFNGDKKNSLSFKATGALKKSNPSVKIVSYNKSLIKNDSVFLNKKKIFDFNLTKHSLLPLYAKLNLVALSIALKKLGIDYRKFDKEKIDISIPGRFNVFQKNGFTVILDYAHEPESLKKNAAYIKKTFKNKKIIAVLRFSYYRTLETIKKMTQDISSLFDYYVIYDKAMSRANLKKIFTTKRSTPAGVVAKLMNKTLKEKNVKSKIIYNEIEAIKKAIKQLKKDEVLYIIGDQIQKDTETIKAGLAKK